MTPTRVLVVDPDRQSREAIVERLQAAGYAVLQIEDPSSRARGELGAEFAVVRTAAAEIDAVTDRRNAGGGTSPSLAIGWVMPEAYSVADASSADLEQTWEQANRIFLAIAPLFL